ncbi:MAG: SusD/RagB family nutrient-binding outer membrane lipoprotein [Ekhidna sp.]
MKKLSYLLIIAISAVSFTACELDLQESPNVLAPEGAEIDFLLNGMELNFASFFHRSSDVTAEVMRMENLTGSTWENAFTGTSFDNIWIDAYADILVESEVLKTLAGESKLFHHRGIARFMEAYTLVTLVDLFGDVPYEEALDPNNFAPNASSGSDIYNGALVLLDSALRDFAKTPLTPASSDLIYGGDSDLWVTAVKTMQLRINLQRRLVDNSAQAAIDALITEGNLIDTDAEALTFQYGTNFQAPASQHPHYNANYAGGAVEYMSNSYMNLMNTDKTAPDPRMTYYFYRQDVDETTDVTERNCINENKPAWYGPNDHFCQVGNGYWGRDHLDNSGIPPDGQARTTYGAYPAGGKYDNGEDVLVANGDGLGGAGIQAMHMPAATNFMLAEAVLELGTAGDAAALYEAGIRASMTTVTGFVAGNATPVDIDSYVTDAMSQYNAAANDAERLELIVKEWYIASWGNGIDMYNAYRRTTYPSGLQPGVRSSDDGAFYRSFIYPASYVSRNANADQKSDNKVQVFWDTNAPDILD